MPNRLPSPARAAVARARWLAQLAHALDEARRLTLRLSSDGAGSSEAARLHVRVVAMHDEILSLQRGRPA